MTSGDWKDVLIREMVAALNAAIRQMRDDVVRIEGEWGSNRNFDQLEDAGELPKAFDRRTAISGETPLLPDTRLFKA